MRVLVIAVLAALAAGEQKAFQVPLRRPVSLGHQSLPPASPPSGNVPPPANLSAAQRASKCASIMQAIRNYRQSGNLRDMADEIRRGELGFVSKRLAESCGADAEMATAIQQAAGRRALVGTGLTIGWLAQRRYMRAADAAFGVNEDAALTAMDPDARQSAEIAGTVGAFMPVAIDTSERYGRLAARAYQHGARAVNGARNVMRAAALAGTAAVGAQRLGNVLTRPVVPRTPYVGSPSRAQAIAARTRQAIQHPVVVKTANGVSRSGKAAFKVISTAPGIAQASMMLGKTVTPLRFALMGHAAVMTGKHLHERNWRAAGKSTIDFVLGGTGTTDLVIDVAKLGHQCFTNATEMKCGRRLLGGMKKGFVAIGNATVNAAARVGRCATGIGEARTCAHAVKNATVAAWNWGKGAVNAVHGFVTNRENQGRFKEHARKAMNFTAHHVKSLGKAETWRKLGRGSVAVVKEVGAIARDAHAAASKALANTTVVRNVKRHWNSFADRVSSGLRSMKRAVSGGDDDKDD